MGKAEFRAFNTAYMFEHQKFEIEIVRQVDPRKLRWPAKDETGPDSGLGCNREYEDFTGRSWSDAQTVLDTERGLISKIEAIYWDLDEEAREAELLEAEMYLDALDLGVAATVNALSAAKCIPFSSCNAGAFGGMHHERYPLVAFHAVRSTVKLIMSAAEQADVGIYGGEFLVVYTDEIRKLSLFAQSLIDRAPQFDALRTTPEKKRPALRRRRNDGQQVLPFE